MQPNRKKKMKKKKKKKKIEKTKNECIVAIVEPLL